MATTKTNIWNLEVGDEIHFTNSANCLIKRKVTRITDSSCYLTQWYGENSHPSIVNHQGGRNSFGTIESYTKYTDFKIIKNN